MSKQLAPCVAIVGPANSGKTSVLHFLDEELQHRRSGPVAYVLKGNPDGTGRYLFHAPELRDRLKPEVKGAWCDETAETVYEWIDNCRRHLDLVLLDLGGRHTPANHRMLRRCSHFIVVARRFEEPQLEADSGMASWESACEKEGLRCVALLRSVLGPEPAVVNDRNGPVLRATFRGDATEPGSATNREIVEAVVDRLIELCPPGRERGYVDLRLGRRWLPEDLADLAGLAPLVAAKARCGEPVVLGGGHAPIWAYASAMHRALDVDEDARIEVFDPKVVSGLVTIPDRLGLPHRHLSEALDVVWQRSATVEGTTLRIGIATADHFLRPHHLAGLSGAPRPAGDPSRGPAVVYGSVPIWLHLTYSRWLRSLGSPAIGGWDAGLRSAVIVSPPGVPAVIRWEVTPADGAGS
jgi:hypothetical protein